MLDAVCVWTRALCRRGFLTPGEITAGAALDVGGDGLAIRWAIGLRGAASLSLVRQPFQSPISTRLS
jgi:hypothetical protein